MKFSHGFSMKIAAGMSRVGPPGPMCRLRVASAPRWQSEELVVAMTTMIALRSVQSKPPGAFAIASFKTLSNSPPSELSPVEWSVM